MRVFALSVIACLFTYSICQEVTTVNPDLCPDHLPWGEPCPSISNMSFTYPDPDHCSMYWECYNQCATNHTCPNDFLYDDENDWCNYPKNVYCDDRDCDGRPCADLQNGTTTTTTTQSSCSGEMPNGDTCPYSETVITYPDTENCALYWECYKGCFNMMNCREDLLYDDTTGWCDYPQKVDCGIRDCNGLPCKNGPTTPSSSSSTSKPCGTLPDGSDCPYTNYYLNFADPEHCSMYWQCYQGCATEHTCSTEMLFDEAASQCMYPDKVDCGTRDCDDRPCMNSPDVFHCPQPNGWFPDDKNCIKYYQCIQNEKFHFTCTYDDVAKEYLVFNPDDLKCESNSLVQCGSRPVCNEHDTNCVADDGFCQEKEDGFYDLGDCESCYAMCSNQITGQDCCDPSLFYNATLPGCDYKTNCPQQL